MKSPLTPEQRSLRSKLASNTRWSRETDRRAATAKARAAALDRFEKQVDPDGILTSQVLNILKGNPDGSGGYTSCLAYGWAPGGSDDNGYIYSGGVDDSGDATNGFLVWIDAGTAGNLNVFPVVAGAAESAKASTFKANGAVLPGLTVGLQDATPGADETFTSNDLITGGSLTAGASDVSAASTGSTRVVMQGTATPDVATPNADTNTFCLCTDGSTGGGLYLCTDSTNPSALVWTKLAAYP